MSRQRNALSLAPLLVGPLVALVLGCSLEPSTGTDRAADTPSPARYVDLSPAHRIGDVLLAGQPTAETLRELATEGWTAVIDLRQPNERRGFDEERVVRQLDMSYDNPGFGNADELTDAVFGDVRELLRRNASGKVLLHCASANRVGAVWLAARVLDEDVPWSVALDEARRVGLRSPAYEEKAMDYVARAGNKEWGPLKEKIRRDLPEVRHVSVDDFARRIGEPDAPLLLDVREPDEYAVSHLPGARRARTLKEALAVLAGEPKEREIVVYCSVGYRSAQLADQLAPKGYTNVRNLEGSIFEWANREHPVFRGDEQVHEVHPYDERWGKLLRRSLRSQL